MTKAIGSRDNGSRGRTVNTCENSLRKNQQNRMKVKKTSENEHLET